MHIAVTTPTGHVGRHVVASLIRAGVRPRVLTRHPGNLTEEVRQSVDVAVCDQFAPDQVVAATEGIDALFWVDPTTGSQDPLADYARATEALIAAIERSGVRRVVFQSSIGAELRHGAGEIDGLAATEAALDRTDADVVQLRCGYFFSNLALDFDALRSGVIRVILPLDQPLAWVDPRDIAEVAVGRLLNREWSGHLIQAVHGPEDLSWERAARIISDALGRELRVERIADELMREGLQAAGMTDGLVEAVMGMSTGLRDGFVPEQARSIVTTTPSTLAGWVHSELRPLLDARPSGDAARLE